MCVRGYLCEQFPFAPVVAAWHRFRCTSRVYLVEADDAIKNSSTTFGFLSRREILPIPNRQITLIWKFAERSLFYVIFFFVKKKSKRASLRSKSTKVKTKRGQKAGQGMSDFLIMARNVHQCCQASVNITSFVSHRIHLRWNIFSASRSQLWVSRCTRTFFVAFCHSKNYT